MNIFNFMGSHPVLTFFLALIISEVFIRVFFNLPNRFFRFLNIRKNGWPPEHCDADGDFYKDE